MGQGNCSLCSCDNKENELHLELGSSDTLKGSKRRQKSLTNVLSPATMRKQELVKTCKANLSQVIKIQALWRGHRDRKQLAHITKQQGGNRYFSQAEKQETAESLAFTLNGRELRQTYTFQSGASYRGEWKGSSRDGKGELIWPDGA